MITKTFKLTVATDNKKQMQKEEEYLSMVYGAEEIEALEQQPCEDVISRQAVLDVLKDKWNIFSDANDAIQESIDTIEALPSVTPQSKTGNWIDDKCSVCGKGTEDLISSREWYRNEDPKFCPFCGVKIKEAENGD